jgi:hypothetical protein
MTDEHWIYIARKVSCRVMPVSVSIVSTGRKSLPRRNRPCAISHLRSRQLQCFGPSQSYESPSRHSKSKLKSLPIGPWRFPVTESVVLPPDPSGAHRSDVQQASSLSPISACFVSVKGSSDQTNSSGWAIKRKSRPIGVMPSADDLQFRRATKFSSRRSFQWDG